MFSMNYHMNMKTALEWDKEGRVYAMQMYPRRFNATP